MTPDFTGDLVIFLGELGALLAAFTFGGFVADFILPHIKPIEQYCDSLPDYEDDVEIARRYEKIRRMKAARRRQIIRESNSKFFRKTLPGSNDYFRRGGCQ